MASIDLALCLRKCINTHFLHEIYCENQPSSVLRSALEEILEVLKDESMKVHFKIGCGEG